MDSARKSALPPWTEWPSYSFWRESDDRVKQFWYVSFCLMMSSIQDRLTGLALRESGNLNWATTAFYYSAVHSGRLVCFVCSGDYPTSHAVLASLFAKSIAPKKQKRKHTSHFDWLDTFRAYLAAPDGGEGAATKSDSGSADNQAQDGRPFIDAIYETMPNLREALDRFSPLLVKFKNLRNDCNYEALLVANEKNHFKATDTFEKLVTSADAASRLACNVAVDAYNLNLRSAECLRPNRDGFHTSHNMFLQSRFVPSLGEKFQQSIIATRELHRIAGDLDWPGTPSGINVDDFLEPIIYNIFGEKQGLMLRWRQDVDLLRGTLEAVALPGEHETVD